MQSQHMISSDEIRQKLQEAEVYLSHRLFQESRNIYKSLLKYYQDHIKNTSAVSLEKGSIPNEMVQFLEQKLKEIDRLQSTPTNEAEQTKDGRTSFQHGIVLRNVGLYDSAIAEFEYAASQQYKQAVCYEEIGTIYLHKKQFPRAITALREAIRQQDITQAQKSRILGKIAKAQEANKDEKMASAENDDGTELDISLQKSQKQIKAVSHRQKRFKFNIEVVCERPWLFLTATILIAAFFIAFVPLLKIENNVDFFFNIADDPSRKIYDEVREVFGNDEFFVIAFEKKDIFTTENLTLLKKITEALEDIEEVRDITSIANVDDTIGEQEYFEVRKFIEEIPESTEELEALKRQAINKPLYVKNIVSPDAKTAAIVVFTHQRQQDDGYRQRLLAKIKNILDQYNTDGIQFYLTGWAAINVSLSEFQNRDMRTFVPLTYLLIPLTILYFFRNFRLVLLAIANISICLGATMGLFGLTGITINGVTTIIQPLVMALALCDTVHIFSHMDKGLLKQFPDRRKALASVLKKVILPCFLTSLTTAIGFLSLSVSNLIAIREFALIASSGMIFEFLFSFFFLPPLILFFKPEKIYCDYSQAKGVTTLLARINTLVQKRYRWIVAATCIIALTAGWYMSQIRVETNPLDYFKKNTSVRKSIDFVEKRLAGVDTLDISLKANVEDAFKFPSNLEIIEKIQTYVNSLKGVDKSISLNDFLKDMNESFHGEDPSYHKLPESMELISQYLLLYDSDDIEDVINSRFDHARIAVRVSEHGTMGQKRLILQVNEFIEILNQPDLEIEVTGRIVQHAGVINAMVNSQIYSLSLAAGIIGVIMLLVLRSLPIGLLSFIPNLFPILLNFGIMGAARIPLNTGTALISAVALGIAVDDTIHFLSEYNQKRKNNYSIPEAVESVIITKGRAIYLSSLILSIGFGVVVLGSFVPIIQFGALTAIIMITAMIGDLIVLPSIILLKREKRVHGAQTETRKRQLVYGSTGLIPKETRPKTTAAQVSQPESSQKYQLFFSRVKKLGLNDKNAYMEEAFSRNIGFLTLTEQQQLADAKVAIPGLGGVGGAHLMTLVRSGVGKFNLSDFDVYEPVNVNRQHGARVPNFGHMKLAVMVEEALGANPFLDIKEFPKGLNSDNIDDFLEGVEVVVDSLDFFAFDLRRLLFKRAREKGVYTVTAAPLGFSSALLVFSPHKGMGFDEYFNIHDGLDQKEKYFRFAMGLAPKATHIKYIDLSKVDLNSKAGPSLGIACQLCSAMAATETLRIILGRKHIKPVPYYCQFDPFLRQFRTGRLFMGNRNPIQLLRMFIAKKLMASRGK